MEEQWANGQRLSLHPFDRGDGDDEDDDDDDDGDDDDDDDGDDGDDDDDEVMPQCKRMELKPAANFWRQKWFNYCTGRHQGKPQDCAFKG